MKLVVLRVLMTVFFCIYDIIYMQNWCSANHMKLNAASKKKKTSLSPESRNVLTFSYVLYHSGVLGRDCIKNFDGFLDSNCTSVSILIISFSMS